MRYSRVLTGLALLGVIALAATLVVRIPVRAATTAHPHPGVGNALHRALNQELQQVLRAAPLIRARPAAPAAQSQGQACFVNQCSLKPCVEFVQGGPNVASPAVQAIPAPAAPLSRSSCARHGNPGRSWVNEQTITAQPANGPTPVVNPGPAPARPGPSGR